MKIQGVMVDGLILEEIGRRVAHIRLEKNLTQSELARQAGVGLRTVQRLESGAVATQLAGLVRIARVLGLVERFDLLFPEAGPSPIAQLKQAGKVRRRASGSPSAPKKSGPWKWGEE